MDVVQTFTNSGNTTDVPVPFEMLTAIQRAYIDWKALGGIITNDDGPTRITLDQLGAMLDTQNPISKQSLSQSCKNVPNFWDLVTERRKKFNSESRMAEFEQRWYVAALSMKNWPVSEAWKRNHDPSYREAKTKVEHDMSDSWLALMQGKDKHASTIEGEIVEPKTNS